VLQLYNINLIIITSEIIFVFFSANFFKPFLRNKIDPMPLTTFNFVQPRMIYHVWLKLVCRFWRRFLTCRYGSLFCGLYPPPPGTMIWTNLNLHYIRKLSSKSELLVLEKIFKWPHSIYAFLWLSPLSFWRGPGCLFEQFLIPFTHGWLVPCLIEIGAVVLDLEKIF
jgi:hypothetical protein